MSGAPVTPPRIVLDHELLWRLGPETTPEEWERSLRRSGLWTLAPGDSEQGKLVRELVRTVQAWPRPADRVGLPTFTPSTRRHWALGLGLGAAVVLLMLYSFVLGLAAITVVLAAAALPVLVQDRQLKIEVAESAEASEGKRATRLLRHLLGRTFVDVAGETIVENVPHRDYLVIRLGEVERALASSETRTAEMTATRDGIRMVNTRLGRAEDDPETRNLDDALAVEAAMHARITGVRDELVARLRDFDGELDRMRVIAERRALSERVSRLTDSGVGEDALRAAAAIEVDVAGIERQLATLKLGMIDGDARLRAVLEVVGAGRG